MKHSKYDLFCERCGAQLTEQTAIWLELNWDTNEWAVPGKTDWSGGDKSQGCFAFGQDCAKITLRKQDHRK